MQKLPAAFEQLFDCPPPAGTHGVRTSSLMWVQALPKTVAKLQLMWTGEDSELALLTPQVLIPLPSVASNETSRC